MIKVVILGSGNVGTHLFKAFNYQLLDGKIETQQKHIDDISNTNKDTVNLKEVAKDLDNADLYILAVNDDSIYELSALLPFKNRLVCHTSGSKSINELNKNNTTALFYMLQTFSKDKEVDLSNVPFCLEADRHEDYLLLETLANAIGKKIYSISNKGKNYT